MSVPGLGGNLGGTHFPNDGSARRAGKAGEATPLVGGAAKPRSDEDTRECPTFLPEVEGHPPRRLRLRGAR